jgi:hypothetical protein
VTKLDKFALEAANVCLKWSKANGKPWENPIFSLDGERVLTEKVLTLPAHRKRQMIKDWLHVEV